MTDTSEFHLHLISDSTGETLHALARAALAPFREEAEAEIHLSVFVRTARDLEVALAGVRAAPGLVWFTVVDPAMQSQIEDACAALGVASTGVLDPLLANLAQFRGETPSHRPGMQHRMNNDYFDRIAALDFAISHDDGAQAGGSENGPGDDKLGQRLKRADVILTGISRTSKTPTCIYLAERGSKAANGPLVPNREPPRAFFEAMAAGVPVIGLTASPSRLGHVRSHRLESLGQPAGPTAGEGVADYADLDRIRNEVADARLFFQRHGIPVIDVTRRSIEETAAAILAELRSRDAGLDSGPNSES